MKKGIRFARGEPWETNRSGRRAETRQFGVGIEKVIEQTAIWFQKTARAFAKPVEIIECHDRHSFRRVSGVGPEKVVEPAHSLGEFGRGQDPAATKAAQTVGFGQAVGDDE